MSRVRYWATDELYGLILDLVVAAVVAVAGFASIATAPSPWEPCTSLALDRGASGWSSSPSAWPPGATCHLSFGTGVTADISPSGWVGVAFVLASIVTVVGLLVPPTKRWFRLGVITAGPTIASAIGIIDWAWEISSPAIHVVQGVVVLMWIPVALWLTVRVVRETVRHLLAERAM